MQRQRMSRRPEVPGMSSREKLGETVALWPTMMKVRIAFRKDWRYKPLSSRDQFEMERLL
jgi:hypothetical protein